MTGGFWHQQADPDWKRLAPTDPEKVMALQPTERHHAKQGRAITRWSLGAGELVVYLKRHFNDAVLARLLAFVTRSHRWTAGWQEYQNLRWATDNGVLVPRPVAVGSCRGPGTHLRGYLAIEELSGQQALHEVIPAAAALLSPRDFLTWKRGLIGELARLTRLLHDRRRFHRDLYLCHFFVPSRYSVTIPRDWQGQVAMIDFHRLAHRRSCWQWWQLKDLAQLLYSSAVVGVTARDRLRFWKLYAGTARHRGLGPWLRRLIVVRWKNYQGHNAARKAAA